MILNSALHSQNAEKSRGFHRTITNIVKKRTMDTSSSGLGTVKRESETSEGAGGKCERVSELEQGLELETIQVKNEKANKDAYNEIQSSKEGLVESAAVDGLASTETGMNGRRDSQLEPEKYEKATTDTFSDIRSLKEVLADLSGEVNTVVDLVLEPNEEKANTDAFVDIPSSKEVTLMLVEPVDGMPSKDEPLVSIDGVKEDLESNLPPVDTSLQAWLVVFACFSSHVWAVSFGAAWGVYQRTLLTENTFPGATNFQLSFVATVSFGVAIVSSIFVGPLSDRVDPRILSVAGTVGMTASLIAASFANQLWILYLTSSLYGFGGCLVIVPSTVVLPAWFSKRRALAMGISVSGTGIGAFILTAVSQACLSAGGWTLGLRVLAGMSFAWMFPASFVLKRRGPASPSKFSWFNFSYFKNAVFALIFLSVMFIMVGFFMPQTYIPLMLNDGGDSNRPPLVL